MATHPLLSAGSCASHANSQNRVGAKSTFVWGAIEVFQESINLAEFCAHIETLFDQERPDLPVDVPHRCRYTEAMPGLRIVVAELDSFIFAF
jgi:hypothetical protein